MEPLELIRSYLPYGRVMQVATVNNDQPWICSVYYVEDNDMNLYWLSFPTRRHSLEIAKHNKIATTIPIKHDRPVIGIQAEGAAEAVADKELIAEVMERYVQRHNAGGRFYDRFDAGENQHVLFRFTPVSYVLFDEVTFPDNGRHEVAL
jgi:uncharacterized protein YhbP (UPF0306 family)